MDEASRVGPDDGDADGPDEAGHRTAEDRATSLPMAQVVGRSVLGMIAVLFVVFAVINRQPVDFSWVFGETQVVKEGDEYVRGGVPLILLMVGSFVLGSIVSAGVLWRRRRSRRVRRP